MTDVGSPAAPGSAAVVPPTAPVFTVKSAGFDVDGTGDQFTYVQRSIRGDVTLIARLATLENVDPWSQAGLMIRENLTAASPHVFLFGTPANGVALRNRKVRRGPTTQSAAGVGFAPVWLKLERRGSTITGFQSVDGKTWTRAGAVSVTLDASPLIGLAVASHARGASVLATFDNVSVDGIPVVNTPPTVTLTAPADKDVYSTPAKVELTATASDSDGTVTRVDFYAGTTLLGTDRTAPYSTSWRGVPVGSYAIKAVATDDQGATTTTPIAMVNVLPVNLPPTVLVGTDKVSYTAPATVMITAVAADRDGTVAKVDFYAGTTLLGTDATNPFAFAWTGVAAGRYAIKAVATDDRGAQATSSVNISVAANQAPTVSMTTDKASYTAPATVVMTAVAADRDGTVAKVDFYAGTTLLATDTSSPFVYTWTGAAAGVYAVRAVATDDKGATTTSATVNIRVASANQAPTVSMTTDKASYTAPATVVMTAVAADRDGTVAKVDFYAGATLLWTDTSSPFAYTWRGAAAGAYAVRAVATDDKGATTTSATVDITVTSANQAPTVSMTTDKASYTAPATVVMTAVAADSDGTVAKVDFYAGATLLATDTSSPFAHTWTGVAAGTYAVRAVATDDKGAATTSATVNITVAPANQAPTVSMTTDKASYVAPATVVMTAVAADSDGTVAKVDFYAGATLLGTDTSSPFAYTWTGVAAGAYAVRAVATDDKGAATTSATVNITVVANQAPMVSMTTDKSSYTAPGTVVMTATAADSDGTVAKVDFYAGATLLWTDTSSPFVYTWTGAAAGAYAVRAVATDDRGASTTSATVNITVAPANQAPTVSMTTDKVNYVAPATVTMTAVAADSDGTVAKVDFYAGATLLWTDTSSPFAYTWTGAAAGAYAIRAVATDDRGASTTSAIVNITVVANQAPTVSMTTDESSYTAPGTVAMTAVAADSDGTVAKVDFYAGATLLGTDTSSPFVYTWTGVTAGTYAVRAVATDDRGASTTSATVNITVVANQAPTVSLTTDKTSYMAPATVVMMAAADDSDGTVAKVEFYSGTTLVGTDTTSPFAFSLGGLPAGSYALKAVATDDRGAWTTSATVTITVVANQAPTVSMTTDKSSYVAPATVVMTAVAADSDGTVAKVDFYAGATLLGTDTSSPFVYTWSGAAAGAYAVRAVATDDRGASTTSAIVNITVVANQAPTVSVTTDKSSYVAPGTVVMTAAAADSDGTVAKVDFYAGTTLLGTDASSPFTYTWTSVAAGTYAVKAVATDDKGAATTSTTVNITVAANQAPTVSLTTDKPSYSAPATVAMTAAAADSDGTVAKVDFYAGTTLLGTDASSPFTYTWTSVAAGTYAVKAVATDDKGAATTSTTVNITVTTAVSGPVGIWAGNEGSGTALIDSSGNGRHGTISGGATWVTGLVGPALDFTGSGVADLGDLDMPGAFTLMAWMNTRSLYAGDCGSLVMKAKDYGLEICGGQLWARVASGGSWTAELWRPMTSADLNTWKHVAMSYDGATLRLYVGGVLVGSAAGAHTTTNNPLLIGRWTPAKEYWNGLVDEVRLYSRVLSQGEIQSDMGAPVANQPPTVSITTDRSSYLLPASVVMTATAADSDGTVAKVDFYAGATLVGTDTTSPFSYTWTGVAAGAYAVRAVATDDKGAATTSATVNITVSAVNMPPTVSLTSPADGASFTAPATVTFAATAADADGTVQKVEFYVGTTLVGTDTTSPYSMTWSAPIGSHSVSAVATDNLGAVTVSSWRNFTVTAAPLVSTAVFRPAVPAGEVDFYVMEVFPAGADPSTAAPIATQNLGLPAVVSGECTADVRATILGLASGNYVATVSAVKGADKLRSPSFAFAR